VGSPAAPGCLTIVVAARNEEERIGDTVASLRRDFPEAQVIVVDGRSDDRTGERAEAAGAVVVRIDRPGKGEALTAGERAAPPGALLLCDADLRGSLLPLLDTRADLAVAAFRRRTGGGFGIAKRFGRGLVRLRTGAAPREPL
jgi:glycosyltransferase involved in cell wall biosynthesis